MEHAAHDTLFHVYQLALHVHGDGTLSQVQLRMVRRPLLANSNDTFFGPTEEPRFVGMLAWKSPSERDTLALGTTAGRGRFNANEPFNPPTAGLPKEPAGHNNFNMIDLVFTHRFNSCFTYALESSYGEQSNVPANVPGGIVRPGAAVGTAHWVSAVNYFRYTFTPRLGGIVRVELFDDIDGQGTGFPGLYTLITGGVQLRPARAILIRPEVRYMSYSQKLWIAE